VPRNSEEEQAISLLIASATEWFKNVCRAVSSWRMEVGPNTEARRSARVRDIFGNPFRPVVFDPEWRTSTAMPLAKQMYESRDFSTMPILADALQDAGCDNDDILNHCRQPGEHVRGCWVVDLLLGKS
jgi:hypothetical protein